jgi:hypothetical protein
MAARDAYEGSAVAAVALLAMAGTAAAGLLLLNADRVGRVDRLTAAVVAMAAGGPADVSVVPAGGLPIAVQGQIQVMPLGVSLVGVVVLGALLLRRGRSGMLMRGASAAVAFTAGLGAMAAFARGTFTLPSGPARAAAGGVGGCSTGASTPFGDAGSVDTLQAGFRVAAGATMVGAAGWALAVVGLCWLAVRFPVVAGTLRAARWPVIGTAAVCVLAAWAFGGPAVVGGVLLALPAAVCGAFLLGLGVPWVMHADGALSCVLDGGWSPAGGGVLTLLSGAVLLALGVTVAARTDRDRTGGPLRRAAGLALRLAPVVALALAVLTLLSRVSVELGVQAFIIAVPVLEVRLAPNPWGALVAGLGAGAAAGFAGVLLVHAFRRRTSVG